MENSKKYTIDRFEGNFAVCETEDLHYINIKIKKLPKDVREGDIIVFDGKKYNIDVSKTLERKKEIEELTKDLWL